MFFETLLTCVVFSISLLAGTGNSTAADQRPLVPWGVHAVVTDGRTTYEGDKLRAVLIYSEIGAPSIVVERVHVEMSYPNASRVEWQLDVDLVGAMADPCPIAETYCAKFHDMRWSSGALVYDVVVPDVTLRLRLPKADIT